MYLRPGKFFRNQILLDYLGRWRNQSCQIFFQSVHSYVFGKGSNFAIFSVNRGWPLQLLYYRTTVKKVLRCFLKVASDTVGSHRPGDSLCKWFQATGAQYAKLLFEPIVLLGTKGTTNRPAVANLSLVLPGTVEVRTRWRDRYSGAVPWRHLYESTHSLCVILSGNLSQRSLLRIRSVTLARPDIRKIRRAAAFRTDCNRLHFSMYRWASTPLQ